MSNFDLVEKYDRELQFRKILPPAHHLVAGLLVALAVFHYYTAGFGLLREVMHRGIHLAFVLGLIFLVFPQTTNFLKFGRSCNIPILDWVAALLIAVGALYMPYVFDDLAFRIGNPNTMDVVMGSIMVIGVIEATRRSMGPMLPCIVLVFILYALYGQYTPGLLKHPGSSWSGLVNHLYLTSQGIYGIPVGVVATYVFHFVLFGVLANHIGAGRLFINLAMVVAGRFAGGTAKVSIFSSALFGMISGSSIANTVTTGSLTIPAMKKSGFPGYYAAAVEATASTGGQITPPIMGAAAFIMIEFLELPYRDIILAACIPAAMHYIGVFSMVHFESKRLGLHGLPDEDIPSFMDVLKQDWEAVIPIGTLITILLMDYSPFYAAFWGINVCIVMGLMKKMTVHEILEALQLGSKYALSVGAAAAAVGIIIGVITQTGMGFKAAYLITQTSAQFSEFISSILPAGWLEANALTLFITLVLTAICCVVLGAGIPTTATYIILVSIAAPALGLLGIEPLVAHFFVFYYGVLADITPPVALAAYAGAGIAGANPFPTGNTAFKLAAAKALVPFVFVYSPSMLIIVNDFSMSAMIATTISCAFGVIALSIALSGYLVSPLSKFQRVLAGLSAITFMAPSFTLTIVGLGLLAPVLVSQLWQKIKT
ncbi:MAG: TRAP transporter permease [Alphaproteobacteria bacterium]